MSQNNGHNTTSLRLKTGLAEMLKGGVIMDVTAAEQADRPALRRGRRDGPRAHPGTDPRRRRIARMASTKKIREIMAASIFPSWRSAASAISPKRRCRNSASITLMNPKC